MSNNKSQAGAAADSSTKDEDIFVSQHSRKPNVACSFSSTRMKNKGIKTKKRFAMSFQIISKNYVSPPMCQPRIVEVGQTTFKIKYREFICINMGRGKPLSFALSKDEKIISLDIRHFKKLNQFLNEALLCNVSIQI